MSEKTIKAYIWFCGDYDCCCHQAVIEEWWQERTMLISGFPQKIWRNNRLWEGKFVSQPTVEELKQMEQELLDECKKRGIKPDSDIINPISSL